MQPWPCSQGAKVVVAAPQHHDDCALGSKADKVYCVLLDNLFHITVLYVPIPPAANKLQIVLSTRSEARNLRNGAVASSLAGRKDLRSAGSTRVLAPVPAPLRLHVVLRGIHSKGHAFQEGHACRSPTTQCAARLAMHALAERWGPRNDLLGEGCRHSSPTEDLRA